MSELKAYTFSAMERIGLADYYLKSEADKVIARQKHKRCLAMAMLCSSYAFAWSFIPEDDEVHKSDFYKKWKKRWQGLAEKYEDACKMANEKGPYKADLILDEEIAEAKLAYLKGEKKHALQELAQCGAVILRIMEKIDNEME